MLSSLEKLLKCLSCLYLLPVVKAAFAKLGRKESSFLKLERFWSFQPGKKKSFQSGKKDSFKLGKVAIVSSSRCQSSFCEARNQRKLIFETGKVLEFPAWKENVFPVWKSKFLNAHGHLLGTSQPYLRNLKQLSSALVHLYTLGLLCLLCYNSLPFLYLLW